MEDNRMKLPHSAIIEERKKLIFSGVTDVGSFDEESITVFTADDEISVKGEKLQVTELNTESGQFCAEGKINSIVYSDKRTKASGFFAKVFR